MNWLYWLHEDVEDLFPEAFVTFDGDRTLYIYGPDFDDDGSPLSWVGLVRLTIGYAYPQEAYENAYKALLRLQIINATSQEGTL